MPFRVRALRILENGGSTSPHLFAVPTVARSGKRVRSARHDDTSAREKCDKPAAGQPTAATTATTATTTTATTTATATTTTTATATTSTVESRRVRPHRSTT